MYIIVNKKTLNNVTNKKRVDNFFNAKTKAVRKNYTQKKLHFIKKVLLLPVQYVFLFFHTPVLQHLV